MKLILIDLDSNKTKPDVAKRKGSFDVTQDEIDNDFYKAVKWGVSKLLHVETEIITIKDESLSMTPWEFFLYEGYSFRIDVTGHSYCVIPQE